MADDRGPSGQVQMVTVGENHDGQRLDNFLLARLKGVPRTWVYRVLRKGEVRVNKGRSKPAYRLKIGDVVRIPPVRRVEKTPGLPAKGLVARVHESIVYEDDAILVLNKPSGVAVHGGSGLSHGVIETLRAARPGGAVPRTGASSRSGYLRLPDAGKKAQCTESAAGTSARRTDRKAVYRPVAGSNPGRVAGAPICRCARTR